MEGLTALHALDDRLICTLMAMEHKAYAFDWKSFDKELHSTLVGSLLSNSIERLDAFIDDHLPSLSCPYDGEPLDADWRSQLEAGDVQELADYALTRYYSPEDDYGIADWLFIIDAVPAHAHPALLGVPLGPPTRYFDPGKMGAYFQTPQRVEESLATLQRVDIPSIAGFRQLLEKSKATGLGLYVTF